MATTQSPVHVIDREEVSDTYEKRQSGILRWIYTGNWEHWVRMATDHIADDIIIDTKREIRAVYLNGKLLTPPPQTS